MRKIFGLATIFCILIVLCSCSNTTKIKKDSPITLKYIYEGINITETLDDEEREKVYSILNNKSYIMTPACPFENNISFEIDGNIFAVACDDCDTIKDVTNNKFIQIGDSNMQYLRSLFKKYAGVKRFY